MSKIIKFRFKYSDSVKLLQWNNLIGFNIKCSLNNTEIQILFSSEYLSKFLYNISDTLVSKCNRIWRQIQKKKFVFENGLRDSEDILLEHTDLR